MSEAQVVSIARTDSERCHAITPKGAPCHNPALVDSKFCRSHQPDSTSELDRFSRHHDIDDESGGVWDLVERIGRRLRGEYEVDEFGFDPGLTEQLLPLLRPLVDKWFRVEVIGNERLPTSGAALLAANHAGTVPIDGVVLKSVVHDHAPQRHLRLLAAHLVFETPFLGALARKTGNTTACQADALRLLNAGEMVAVFPEGFKGVGKAFADRYRMQRFGRGGFVETAIRAGVPIIPTAIVGSEEIYPKIADVRPLARLLGFPYFPITPTFPLLGPLGLVPLPSKWIIEFCEPVLTEDFGEDAASDPVVMFEVTDRVRQSIQKTLLKNLRLRRNVFW